MNLHLQDRVIIVTGGGSGIGAAISLGLIAEGAIPVIFGHQPLSPAFAAELEQQGQSHFIRVELRDEDACRAAVNEVQQRFGRIDGLVNNAGGQYRSELAAISTKGFEAVVRNNLTGGFIFMREVYTRWMQQHGGAIVNIIADIWNGWPNFAHSGAARGGMLTLTESAASEWAGSGVRVNTVAPGGIASSGFDVYTPEAFEVIREIARKVPMQRFGNESEVSSAIVYLLSPAASYITGSCVRVDGGSPNARQTGTMGTESRVPAFDGFHRAKPVRT
jgi:citronellol/citronellal dehydrogenase